MGSPEWQGGATAVAQVVTLTLGGTWETTDEVNITLYDEAGSPTTLNVVAGSTTIATIAATIATAFNASTSSRFTPITAAAGATTVTLTADTAGVPIYCSVTTTETGGGAADSQTFSAAVTTANSGPNDWNTAANWSTGAVPVDSDTPVISAKSSESILYGLYQTTALSLLSDVELASLKIEQGAPQIGTLDAGLCVQYALLDVGMIPADGVARTSAAIWNLKPGNYAVAGTIRSTRNQGSGGRAPLQIDADSASSTFRVLGDSIVGFATAVFSETSTIGTITVEDRARVTCGPGLTLTTLNPLGGTTSLSAGATTINYGGGGVNIVGAGNVTTLTAGGNVIWNSTGTVTNFYAKGNAKVTALAGTFTNATVDGPNATLDASSQATVFTNGVDTIDGADSRQVNFGTNKTVTPSAL